MKEYIMKFDGTEYAFLSNFWESEVNLIFDHDVNDFNLYKTVEHAY
jgi:hypothetical protein